MDSDKIIQWSIGLMELTSAEKIVWSLVNEGDADKEAGFGATPLRGEDGETNSFIVPTRRVRYFDWLESFIETAIMEMQGYNSGMRTKRCWNTNIPTASCSSTCSNWFIASPQPKRISSSTVSLPTANYLKRLSE